MDITTPRDWRRRARTTGLSAAVLATAGACGLAATAPTASAQRQPGQTDCVVDYDTAGWLNKYGQYQQLLGRTPDGQRPDGVATEPEFSRDSRRNARIIFTSTATNIAGPVRPGTRNIYVVKRAGTAGPLGDAWRVGSTVLVTKGAGGAPANGDSFGGSISGYTGTADAPKGPGKIAFLSTATNLPGGNPTGTSAYTASANGGSVRRLKVPGTATGVGISGDSKVVYVSTAKGLYVVRGSRVKRLVAGGDIDSPSTTLNGNQAAYAKNGKIYTVTIGGTRKFVTNGTLPQADGGEPSSKGQGMVRAISFSRGGGAWKAQLRPKKSVKEFGPRSNGATGVNGGGAAIAFGNGANVCVRVEVIVGPKAGQLGGYAIPQGGCPAGQGNVVDVALSTRYNYVAFTCSAGGLYHYWIGDKNNARHAVS